MDAAEFNRLLTNDDISLFKVECQTGSGDKKSLILVQKFMRSWRPQYSYLELGSYRGGSLLPHLVDDLCASVVSIDPRPKSQPDERAQNYSYEGITTAVMIEALRPYVSLSGLQKLTTFDSDASKVSPAAIGRKIDLAMIDGEHTNTAVFSDFLSILPCLSENAVVVFHDVNLISDGFKNIDMFLSYMGVSHRLFLLADVVGIIALRGSIGPASEFFGPHALDEAAFIRQAKISLRECIAEAVKAGLHLL